MIRWFLTLVLLQVSLTLTCRAQSNDTNGSGQSPSTTGTPDTASKPAPNPPKKVWTNDDITGADKKVPTAGDKSSQKYPLSKTPDPATVERIRKSLEKLQGQIEEIRKQLASYREFLKGEPVSTSGYQVEKGYGRIPVEQQMVMLEKKKKDLETQIDALYEEARKKGIDPGLLRSTE